jgi:hypothetical protein
VQDASSPISPPNFFMLFPPLLAHTSSINLWMMYILMKHWHHQTQLHNSFTRSHNGAFRRARDCHAGLRGCRHHRYVNRSMNTQHGRLSFLAIRKPIPPIGTFIFFAYESFKGRAKWEILFVSFIEASVYLISAVLDPADLPTFGPANSSMFRYLSWMCTCPFLIKVQSTDVHAKPATPHFNTHLSYVKARLSFLRILININNQRMPSSLTPRKRTHSLRTFYS